MLTIRREQLAALSDHEVRKFEDWMVSHLERFFPDECSRIGGDPGLRDLVRHGIDRSAGYGITRKRDICTYVDLMMVLGRDFDIDDRFAWASAILAGPWTASDKVSALHESAKNHFRLR